MSQGPNVKKLIIHRMAMVIVPSDGGVINVIEVFKDADRLTRTAREATAWVKEAIAAVKAARDNPYGDDDEAIAGEILRQIKKKTS